MRSSRSNTSTRPNRNGRRRPEWITDELVADTLSTWQPYYRETLTEEDAIAMLLTVGRLADVLEVTHAEQQAKVRRSGSRLKP